MPINKNALIRYKVIDSCLRNNYHKWTINDLIEKCSEALYEFEGIETQISKRTIQLDIRFMRSNAGYNAPIIVYDKKYYKYEDTDFSITNSPLNKEDAKRINEAVKLLKQFNGFNYFDDIFSSILKIEQKISNENNKEFLSIDFEKTENLKGINFIENLHKAILKSQEILINYNPFVENDFPNDIYFQPYQLKEYNNRWFVLGFKKGNTAPYVLALDRIDDITQLDSHFEKKSNFNPTNYFKDTIGVTVVKRKAETIIIKLNKYYAPYILTKPLHHSQKTIKQTDSYTLISIYVKINKELISKILSIGNNAELIEPIELRKKIKNILGRSFKKY